MKKINYTLFAAALGLATFGLSSCNDEDYLDVPQYEILPSDKMFQSHDDVMAGLNGIYDMLFADNTYADAWNYKPQLFFGCHPTLDTQATGWDVRWGTQSWNADDADLKKGFMYAYRAISFANDFLVGLENPANDSVQAMKNLKLVDGEAHALRAYFYMFLAENWGKIPMLSTGEDFINTPVKAAAETDDEVWDFIIDDLKKASEELDWKPQDGQYGRCTKGMALSYLGEAYLWKAYKARFNKEDASKSTENIKLAKAALEQVVNSGVYELSPSFSTLWDAGEAWPKECVWQVVNDMGKGNYGKWDSDAHIFNNFFAGSTNGGGGWGSEYISWELYFSYEKGDKRRDASMCTSPVKELPEEYRSKTSYGVNPFLQQKLGPNDDYMFESAGAYAPGVWTMKLWRMQRCQWTNPHSPCHFYYKRYAGVLFDYAECLFRLNENVDKAWAIIDQVRNRAFGNDEVGKGEALTSKNLAYYNSLVGQGGYEDYKAMTEYPIPFNTAKVDVPSAKEYYTKICNEGLTLDKIGRVSMPFKGLQPWEVALGQERRKEFSSEWNLKADLQRSEFLFPSIEYNYPKGVGLDVTDKGKADNWHYYRTWDPVESRLVMPFPTDEVLKNSLIQQKPGY